VNREIEHAALPTESTSGTKRKNAEEDTSAEGPARKQPKRAVKAEWTPPEVSDKGFRPKQQPNHIYPAQSELPWYNRPSMSTSLTRTMRENVEDSGDNKKIMQVDSLSKKPQGLKNLELSRNHIIADSSTARLLTEAHGNVTKGSDGHKAVNDFISTMAGHGSPDAKAGMDAFEKSLDAKGSSAAKGYLNQAIKSTSLGRNNLRFDDAGANTDILHGADYELNGKGEVSGRSEAARDAVMNLARNGAVKPESAFNAVQPTIKYTENDGVRTGQYASSSLGNQGYDAGAKWGDMQDSETLRPRNPDHFDTGNDGGRAGRAASEPPDMPSDQEKGTEFRKDG
jgi:hypothetical protein